MLEVNIDRFSYSKAEKLLGPLNFSLSKGKHLAILGESGSGKSTLLHLIYGLLDLQVGEISWKGKPVPGPRQQLVPGASYMKLVAQEANVMPFTTVSENIREHFSRLYPEKENARTTELLELLGLSPLADQMVKSLSGGQKQRVAIAKALAVEPEVLLLDEPFAHIDEFRRSRLRRLLYSYLKQKGITCITATHDASEALSFADFILILENGEVSFFGPPQELYNNVSSAYQAGFFGEINELPGPDGKLQYLFPSQLEISNQRSNVNVSVLDNYFKGGHYLIHGSWNGIDIFFNNDVPLKQNQTVYLKIKNNALS